MRFLSYNVNGLRSVLSKDKAGVKGTNNPNVIRTLVDEYDPDVICLQESRCPADLSFECPFPFKHILASKTKKGYSGVAVFSKEYPMNVLEDFPDNEEGRVLCLEYERFYLLNVYTPNSKHELLRLDYRINVWEPMIRRYVNQLQERKPVLFCSDFNVAPTHLDVFCNVNSQLEKSPGYTPEERDAFQQLQHECGMVDTFRMLHPELRKYSWFSNFGKARENNHGWRIDGWLVPEALKDKVKGADILCDVHASDHCPVLLDMEI